MAEEKSALAGRRDGLQHGLSHCPRCAASFICGAAAGHDTCWCAELPARKRVQTIAQPDSSAAGCYCRECLQALLSAPPGRA